MKNLLTLAVSICFASGLAFAEGEATTTHEPQAAAPEAMNKAPKKKPAKKGHEDKNKKNEEGATTPTTH